MTDWTMQSDTVDPQILSRRLGAFVRRLPLPTKDFAARIECDLRTAENIRAGRTWPIARHWLRIWLEFGDDAVEAVFYPERVEARLAREAAERERQKRARIAATALVEARAFSLESSLGEPQEPDAELEPGPPNLDLFESAGQ
jgi:hypothetical protein